MVKPLPVVQLKFAISNGRSNQDPNEVSEDLPTLETLSIETGTATCC